MFTLPRTASELDMEHKREMTEAEKLREEVNRTRAMRASRQSSRSAQLSISSLPASPAGTLKLSPSGADEGNKISTSATSFPVFAGRTTGGPTSLANFIGGDTRVKGPLLNKVRPDQYAGHGLETDALDKPTATFLSRLNAGSNGPGHFGKNKVAMPGMVRPASTPVPAVADPDVQATSTAISADSPQRDNPEKSVSLPIPGAVNHGEGRPRSAQGLVRPSSPIDQLPAPAPTAAAGESASTSSKAPESSIGKVSSPLLGGQSSQTSLSSSSKMPTASLTRLQGSNIVKQRLAWGEEQTAFAEKEASSARSTPNASPRVGAGRSSPKIPLSTNAADSSVPASPALGLKVATKAAKRGSVTDRWNMRPTSDEDASKASAASYKAGYGVGVRSPPLGGSSEASSQPGPTAEKPALISENERTSKQTMAEPFKPLVAPKPSLSLVTPDDSKPTATREQSASPLHDQGIRSQGSSSSAYKAEYGVKSPALSTPTEAQPERKPSIKLDYESEESSPTVLAPVLTTEPGQYSPAPKSPVSASAESGSGSLVRPNKPPTFTSWPKPQSHSSNFSRPASAVSPKPSSSLPISVSPVAYSPGPKSPSASSPRAGTFQPSATSFPVSLGVAPTHARPTSLAHFMGADKRINGPVLNKVRQIDPADEGVDMGDEKGRVGTFLSGMNKDHLLAEAARRKQGVPMPGLVPRSPAPISPKPTSVQAPVAEATSSSMDGRSTSAEASAAPKLPLPGMASPKLPYPGESADQARDDASDEEQQQHTGSAKPPLLPEVSSSFSSAFASMITESSEPPMPTTTGEAPKEDDPTMSRLLRSGYATQRSLQTIQPSERMAAADSPRRTAMEMSTECTRQGRGAPPQVAANPWREDQSHPIRPSVAEGSSHDRSDWQATLKVIGKPARHAPLPPSSAPSKEVEDAVAKLGCAPSVDTSAFDTPYRTAPYVRYLSTDILSIVGASTHPIPAEAGGQPPVFYASELLAIVLRHKEGGLVVTSLYIWQGRDATVEAAEEGKIAELETRYRTTAIDADHGAEPDELVKALGGTLIVRQGRRDTFDVLNTTLYKVQTPAAGLALIDELDLERSSLSSAYSFVASIFEDIFVWHGRGSTDFDRAAAVAYAQSLASSATDLPQRKVAELEEGQEGDFWQDMMGEQDYASADYWRFRRSFVPLDRDYRPRVLVVSEQGGSLKLVRQDVPSPIDESSDVHIVDLHFELFVVVPNAAQMKKDAIHAAVEASCKRSAATKQSKPFPAPVHTLLLPSVIPLDLAASFRSSIFGESPFPRRMNLMTADETKIQLSRLEHGQSLSHEED